jgi:GTPase SAR1 family protein
MDNNDTKAIVIDDDAVTTSSLQALQSTDQRKVMDIVDKLRRTGLSGIVELPQLVVCGDQSSGKSSVLEAITEIPFPRKENLCTRFATEVCLSPWGG